MGDLFTLRILPSCQILDYCHQNLKSESTNTIGIVEDASEDLLYTVYECQTLAKEYNIEPHLRLQGRGATVKEYRKLASQVNILHSSHHGSANSNDPLESALILSDGRLTLGELLTPGWRNALKNLTDVYLNNCETNYSVNKITDDLLSIATGFLCGGVQNVVSTLWSVEDCASALLAIFYYDFRHSGASRSQALQQAQQKLRNLTGKQLKEEYLEQLESNLAGQLEQAKIKLENAQNQEEREKYQKIAENIQKQIQEILPKHCQSLHPFANPFYWAGFISQGLT